MSLLSYLSNPSTTKPSHIFHTLTREKTSTELGKNIGRNYRQGIRSKPTISRRLEVHGMYSGKDQDLNNFAHAKSFSSKNSLLYGLYQFTRPHTTIGTILSITSVSTLALNSWAQVSPAFLLEVLKAIAPTCLLNIYAVGIDQIFDVKIDKVNKPYLPLASGVIPMKLGVGIVATSLIMGLFLGMKSGSPALIAALLYFFIGGSVYTVELPFLRWKRNPFLASTIIVLARAIVVQFAYFIHMQKYVLGEPIVFSRAVLFSACFMFLLTGVISMFKDIPDVEGDKIHGVKSLSVTLGQQRVFWMCIGILMAAYGGAIAVGLSSTSFALNKIVAVLGHFSLASLLMYRALQVNISSAESVYDLYMLIWKLFYAEYLLIPFMR